MKQMLKTQWLLVAGLVTAPGWTALGQEISTDYNIFDSGEEIIVTFSEGPGNPKDWVGVYKGEMVPGSVGSLAWFYVDGTKAGNEEIETGTIAFVGGMIAEGDYKAVFFENDGYTIFAETPFKVQQAAPDTPQLVSSSPQDGSKNADPAIAFKAVIRNGSTSLNLEIVKLSLNNQDLKVDNFHYFEDFLELEDLQIFSVQSTVL